MNNFLMCTIWANTQSAKHYAGLTRLPGKRKPVNWQFPLIVAIAFVAGVAIGRLT